MKVLFLIILISLSLALVSVAVGAEIYIWSSYATTENSKGNSYVSFSADERLCGFGFSSHFLQKNKDRFDFRLGLGKSTSNINISQSFNFMGKNYIIEKELNYKTGMYLFESSYRYKFFKNFDVEVSFQQSKNVLKRNEYLIKLTYIF
ncbi:hypothetical protein QI155_03245 [Thermodesulfovibrio sp. 1176]|uniref:hypothetical protein n=1 Tax=Thermodesulfovibrio sp. 1176 TaxID=3043424 RepID=UPI0024826868|nr:hypothetical protein [Thermodesulfovibrio sp. 1176]MDI1471539.1 hypothetical protein [Thermodesulfovibrio sp. 1176]